MVIVGLNDGLSIMVSSLNNDDDDDYINESLEMEWHCICDG